VPTYLAQAIICFVLFNPVAGAVAIWFAWQTRRKLAIGDVDGATTGSRRARTWCWISVAIGVAVILLIMTKAIPNPYA
jgi:hypothetical protein